MAELGHRIALQRKSRGLSIAVGLRGTKLWELTLRKFRVANKDSCKAVSQSMTQKPAPKVTFLTGSTYEGDRTELGMCGKGTYEFPMKKPGQRLVYTGEFDDGLFDGNGTLCYPDGNTIEGKWHDGALHDKKLCFSDGLEYSETGWRYCAFPDRRYTAEYDGGLLAAGDSYITSQRVPRDIPPGYYDVGDGLYDPITKNVVRYEDPTYLIRASSRQESAWIVDNCRVSDLTLTPLGPCPFLYDEWMAPALEAEYPPPPAANTKQFADDKKEIDDWLKRNAQRDSTPFSRRSGLFSFRKVTGDHGYQFYRPSYFRRSSAASFGSQRGRLTFEVSTRPSVQSPLLERHKSMFRSGHQHKSSTRLVDHDTKPKVFTDNIIEAKREAEDGKAEKPYFVMRRESTENKGPIAMPQRINW